jgi:hypothetical protein
MSVSNPNTIEAESLRKFCLKNPGSFTTAIFCFSFDFTAKNTEPRMKRIITIGKRKVDRINDLFLTLVRYSRWMMMPILLI